MKNICDQLLNALRAAEERGLLIDELETQLGVDSQTITSALEQLISEGRIMEKSNTKESRYFIDTQMGEDTERGGLTDLNGCPCFHCLRISKCGVRQPDSPVACKELEGWMVISHPS